MTSINDHWFKFTFMNPFTDEQICFTEFCRMRNEYIEERIQEVEESYASNGVFDWCSKISPTAIAHSDARMFEIPDGYEFDSSGQNLQPTFDLNQ